MSRVRWSLGAVCLAFFTACTPPAPEPVVMPSDNLGDITVGVAYSHTITATGGTGALSYSATGLPAGLSIGGGTGAITGTATASGDFTVYVTATDTQGANASQDYPLKVYDAPTLTVTVPALANLGSPFNGLLQAAGGKAPVTFSVASGQLPPGLTVNASSGTITGTPTFAGTFTATAAATDANGAVATRPLGIDVLSGAPPSVVTASLPDGVVDTVYLQTLVVQNGQPPYSWALTSGSLPAGLSLSTSGQIAGTPSAAGNSTFQVAVTDAAGQTARGNLALVVFTPLQVTTSALPDGYAMVAYTTTTLVAAGGRAPYTWTIVSALPSGLSFNAATATVSGMPSSSSAGSHGVTFVVTDGSGQTRSASYTIAVHSPPSITVVSYPDAYTGQAYSGTATGAGGKAPYTWSVSAGSLPAGLTLDASSGAVTGAATGTTQALTLTLSDANGVTASQPVTIDVYALPSITSASPLADGYAGLPYASTFAASGGKAPLTWSQTAGTLPAGLTLSTGGVLGSTIAGGQATGGCSFTVSVMDANGRVASAPFTLSVYRPPSITTTALTAATEGVTYLRSPGTPEQLTAIDGKAPLSFGVGTGLPPGIALSSTGAFSGIPAQGTAGLYAATFTVTDANGRTGSASLNLQVSAARPLYGGGTSGIAPAGSPITDVLTVFTVDSQGNPYANLGVRLRKNGVEFSPVKEQVTDAAGKTVFTGLGLNGTTDTVDITANGAQVVNTSWQKVNAALVTIPLLDYPLPLPRAFANGEIDPPSGKLLVTAGQSGGGCLDDTLRLTDSTAGTWAEDQPPGMTAAPPVRHGSGMAYSATAGVHVLFGGVDCADQRMLSDVWHYRAATGTWTRQTPASIAPSARALPAMGGLSSGQIVLFGGYASGGSPWYLGDLYVYDPATVTWTQRTPVPMPPARYGAGSVGTGNLFWLCGGAGATELSDCWSYDAAVNTWTSRLALPTGARQNHAMAAASATQFYLFGGVSGGVDRNDLLLNTSGAWTTPTQTNPPPAREGAVLAYEPSTGNLLMFGGRNQAGQYFSDLWSYSPGTGAWTQRAPTFAPPAATGFTLSGTIAGGNTGTRSWFFLHVTGTSGYANLVFGTLVNGTGSYTVTGIPAGDTIAVTVLNEDRSQTVYPNRMWSFLDLGVVATNVSSNLTRYITLPPGPMTSQLLTTTGSFTFPSGWLGTDFPSSLSRVYRPGFSGRAYGRNGTSQLTGLTFRNDYFPTGPGTGQLLLTTQSSAIASACEALTVYEYNVAPGPFPSIVVPPGPRSLSPGLNPCTPGGIGLQWHDGVAGPQAQIGGVAVADVSGDGIADLAMVSGNQVLLFYGQGSGAGWYNPSASLTLALPAGSNGNGIGIADFDRDGRMDLAVGQVALSQMAVMLQTTSGTFSTFPVPTSVPVTGSLSVGDVNDDTFADIVVTGGSQVSEVDGRGDGTFAAPFTLGFGSQVTALSDIVDLDGDGVRDVAYGLANAVGFLRGNRGGNLGNAGTAIGGIGGTPVSIAAGDLDGDGIHDLAVASQSPSSLQTWRGQPGFSYTQVSNRSLTAAPFRVGIAEMTGDSLKDVVLAESDSVVIVFNGTGGGAISQFFNAQAYGAPQVLAIGDLNTDDNADVVVGHSSNPPLVTSSGLQMFLARRAIPAGTDALSFVAPANTRLYVVRRGPHNVAWDYEVVSRGTAGSNSVSYPPLSTLRPGRPSPVGQTVGWQPTLYLASNPANVNMDNLQFSLLHEDAEATLPVDPVTGQELMSRYRRQ